MIPIYENNIFNMDLKTSNEILKDIEYKTPTSEAEYWKLHSIYSKKIDVLNLKSLTYVGRHHLLFNKFETLLKEMVVLQLVSPEWAWNELQLLYKKYDQGMKDSDVKGRVKGFLRKNKKKLKKKN